MDIKEANQLTSNFIFNWVKEKVIEGKTLEEITKEPDYLSLEEKIRSWRENPIQNAHIPESFSIFHQVKDIYEQKLNAYTCFLGELNIDYYIEKLDKIPAKLWCEGESILPNGQKDIWGHCGHIPVPGDATLNSEEAIRLWVMTYSFLGPLTNINDGIATFNGGTKPRGNNPKERVVNALKFFKYEMDQVRLNDMKNFLNEKEFPIEKD